MHSVIETRFYLAKAAEAGLTEAERDRIVGYLAGHPMAGDAIPGAGGARKVRFAGRGKGKSGGYRVVTFFGGHDIPVFLLTVFSKGTRTDLTQAERNAIRQELAGLADDYRRGVRVYVNRR